jgi:hypothetical protein
VTGLAGPRHGRGDWEGRRRAGRAAGTGATGKEAT